MTIGWLVGRFETAAWFCAITACVTTLPRMALRGWEKNLADAAIQACVERGGSALVGADRVVSCAPCTLSKGRTP